MNLEDFVKLGFEAFKNTVPKLAPKVEPPVSVSTISYVHNYGSNCTVNHYYPSYPSPDASASGSIVPPSGTTTSSLPTITFPNEDKPFASLSNCWGSVDSSSSLSNLIIFSLVSYGWFLYQESINLDSSLLKKSSYNYQLEILIWQEIENMKE